MYILNKYGISSGCDNTADNTPITLAQQLLLFFLLFPTTPLLLLLPLARSP